jgi:hypothetical protein
MKAGTYNPDDPEGEFGIQNMPDSWIPLHREWHDFEYGEYDLKVEIVKYLDGSVKCNAIRFIDPAHEMEFLEAAMDFLDGGGFEDKDDKFTNMWKSIESQLC